MKSITQQEMTDYVEENIQAFHQRRLDSLRKLKLMDVVKRKNPDLFKAKNINTASEFVKTILDAFLSSQEEGIFGGKVKKKIRQVLRNALHFNLEGREGCATVRTKSISIFLPFFRIVSEDKL